jgi:uncharacterized repeat protein (TIGR01451 family)
MIGERDEIRAALKGRMLRIILSMLVLCAVWLVSSSRADAAPGAAWQLRISASPTNLQPGTTGGQRVAPVYVVTAKNIGGGPTSGAITVTDQLPAGIELSPAGGLSARYGSEGESTFLSCSSSGQTVTCVGPGPVYAGQEVVMTIPLRVPATEGSVADVATVEGGGIEGSSTSLTSVVSSVPAPFGFVGGEAGGFGSITNADGSIDVQAGSHPYQLSVGMALNQVAPGEAGDPLRIPAGGEKDISGELPQGVVVNPEAAPKCTEAEFESEAQCPI